MTISRATLPQEFFDITSAKMLVAPDSQFIFARLWRNALRASLNPDAQLGLPIAGRQFGGNGAAYSQPEEGRLMLADDIASSAIVVVPEVGKAPGHTVRLNRPVFTNTNYSEAVREVPANTTISTTPGNVSSDQVSVVLKRYAGPVAADGSGNYTPRPYAVDRFDATVAMHKTSQIVGTHLKRDFDATVEGFLVNLFSQAGTIVRPEGFSSDDSSTIAGDARFSYSLIAKTERALDEANVPTLPDGKRIMVISPYQAEQLSQSAQFSRLSEDHPLFNVLYAGSYWRTVGAFHIFKSNTLKKTNNTNSVPIHYGMAFGPGAVGSGVGELPRVAYSSNDNYGETALLIWLMYAAFATLDSRFIVSVRTS